MQKTLTLALKQILDTADETDVTCLPESLTSLFDSTAVDLGNNDLTSLCKNISQYHQEFRQKSHDNLAKVTILQRYNEIIIGNYTEEAE